MYAGPYAGGSLFAARGGDAIGICGKAGIIGKVIGTGVVAGRAICAGVAAGVGLGVGLTGESKVGTTGSGIGIDLLSKVAIAWIALLVSLPKVRKGNCVFCLSINDIMSPTD